MAAADTTALHITSFVIRALPERLAQVMTAVERLEGVEVHGDDGLGKFIALLELESDRAMVETITAIELIPGVINTSMVYHHAE